MSNYLSILGQISQLAVLGFILSIFSNSVQAQSSCISNPQYPFCCDPSIDICLPRTTQVKYGVTAGDLCVKDYPSPQSCGGTYSWAANFSSPDESIEWRRGFISKYWNDIESLWAHSGLYNQCSSLDIEVDNGVWSAPEQELKLGFMQYQGWKTVAFHIGAPPQGGNYSCAYPSALPQHFNVLRYLVEDECDEGFVAGRLKTDDTRVCTKKIPLEISITGPNSTQALPSLTGPIKQTVNVTRLGNAQPNVVVTIQQRNFPQAGTQTVSGVTDNAGEFHFIYIPPYWKTSVAEITAKCAQCDKDAVKEISVIDAESQSCRR